MEGTKMNNSTKKFIIAAVTAGLLSSCGKINLKELEDSLMSLNLKDFQNYSVDQQRNYLGRFVRICRPLPPEPLPPTDPTDPKNPGQPLPPIAKDPADPNSDVVKYPVDDVNDKDPQPLPQPLPPYECVPVCIIKKYPVDCGTGSGTVDGGTDKVPVASNMISEGDQCYIGAEASTGWVDVSQLNKLPQESSATNDEIYIGECPIPVPEPLPLPFPMPPIEVQPGPNEQVPVNKDPASTVIQTQGYASRDL